MHRYMMFTNPGCPRCAVARAYFIAKKDKIRGEEFSLATPEGLEAIRGIYPQVRPFIPRDEKGRSPVPIIIIFDEKDEIIDVVFAAEMLVPYLEDDEAYKAMLPQRQQEIAHMRSLAHTHEHTDTSKEENEK